MAEIALQYVTLTWQMKNTFPHSNLKGREPEYIYLPWPVLGLSAARTECGTGTLLSHLLSAGLDPLGWEGV